MNKTPKIYVAGHRGLVGSAIVRRIKAAGLSGEAILTRARAALDLTEQGAVRAFFEKERPDQVYIASIPNSLHNRYPKTPC